MTQRYCVIHNRIVESKCSYITLTLQSDDCIFEVLHNFTDHSGRSRLVQRVVCWPAWRTTAISTPTPKTTELTIHISCEVPSSACSGPLSDTSKEAGACASLVTYLGDLYTESGQTLQGSFSAVSKPNFASKYSLESSRRDLHNALLCTVLNAQNFRQKSLKFLLIFWPNFA